MARTPSIPTIPTVAPQHAGPDQHGLRRVGQDASYHRDRAREMAILAVLIAAASAEPAMAPLAVR